MSVFAIVILSLMGVWFVINTVLLWKGVNRAAYAANEGVMYEVECEKCGTRHEVTYRQLRKHKTYKEKSVSVGVSTPVAGVDTTHVVKQSRKVFCPVCGKETWNIVLDYDENWFGSEKIINNTKAVLPTVIRYFVSLFAGGAVAMIIFKIGSLFM
ncbi:MAG: hypothetical protein HUJ79_02320 [Firmicutes bacterium]|nr:hypothetical protein [Bacillota bacterium]